MLDATIEANTQRVYRTLFDAIRAGRIEPGARFPNERQLAADHRASRAQVRDALLMLQKEGLIERKVGSGTFLSVRAAQIVERLDAQVDTAADHEHSFAETLEARLIIEPGVAALAARNGSVADFQALREALGAVLEAGDWLSFKQRIYHFSRLYYLASGNDFLLRTFDQIVAARRQYKFDGHRERGRVAAIVRRHAHQQLAAICDAIVSRDERRAETEVARYLSGMVASGGL